MESSHENFFDRGSWNAATIPRGCGFASCWMLAFFSAVCPENKTGEKVPSLN